jgi:hypothetical protein
VTPYPRGQVILPPTALRVNGAKGRSGVNDVAVCSARQPRPTTEFCAAGIAIETPTPAMMKGASMCE